MSYNFECPYCESDLGDADDCREPSEIYEWECGACDKRFVFTIEYDISYSTQKADCLNDTTHDYQKITGYPTELFENQRRCSMCSREITIKPSEVKNG